MIYELRIYRCVPSRMPALLSRFENKTLRIWEKHGIRQAGFWTTLIGASSLSFLVSRARVRLKNQRNGTPIRRALTSGRVVLRGRHHLYRVAQRSDERVAAALRQQEPWMVR
jgi:NIPSNAP